MYLRSNLSKARGLGAAHEGAHHWLSQRITAVALIPLVFWFVSSVIKATAAHGAVGVIYLLSSPFNAIAMILFLSVAIYHGLLGFKVVIEDYVHCPCAKWSLEIGTKFVSIISIVAVAFTILFAHINSYKNPERFNPGFWENAGKDAKTSVNQENGAVSNPVINTESPKE